MSVKLMAFLKAAAGLSREQFIDYYETNHVALILRSMPGIIEYRRNFLPEPVGGYDVVTELYFEDMASFDHAMGIAMLEDIGNQIAADEGNFLDRSATVIHLVDERGGVVR